MTSGEMVSEVEFAVEWCRKSSCRPNDAFNRTADLIEQLLRENKELEEALEQIYNFPWMGSHLGQRIEMTASSLTPQLNRWLKRRVEGGGVDGG